MLWNPVATARFLPGQWIPAAQVIHGGEALLAILAVLVWHFYSVHLRHFNRAMFTGQMTEEEMEHEHPLELERIKGGGGAAGRRPPVLARRQKVFLPVAGVVAALLLAGIYWFVTFEQTAITHPLPVREARSDQHLAVPRRSPTGARGSPEGPGEGLTGGSVPPAPRIT